ncbi:MAG: DegT/DnrJ/EryC1/StrS family aminotransferase [Actinomycetota bacterium]|nr:DegT/DnrJ/EryC1/StrS family aminotransferase [Actinomycetota bacterium]
MRAFEEEFAEACGAAHCVAVSSGTDALALGLRALGLRAGEEVVVPTNSFVATAEAVSHAGGVPALADCDGQTYTIDPGGVAARACETVRGVIGVHLYGRPADWDALEALARPQGWWTVEDAAQAHLARYRDRPVGSLGHLAAFSFYPAKNLGAPGEGGAVTTGDPELAQELRMLRDHGQAHRYRSDLIGYNARMSELVAATLRIKLPYLPEWTEARRRVAAWYRQRLADHPDIGLPVEPDWARSVHHLFVVAVSQRDRVQTLMEEAGVETGLHYPVPIHLQPAYRHLGHDVGAFPQAELAAESLLSLPMFPTLREDQVDYVCDVLGRSVQQARNRAGPR